MKKSKYLFVLLALLTMVSPVWARIDKKLTEHRLYYNSTWLSQNKIIYVTDQDGQYDIWSMNADSAGNAKLTNDLYIEGMVTKFCPFSDGSKIVYVRKCTDKDVICVMNADGTGQSEIYTSNEAIADLDISPNNQRLAFTLSDQNVLAVINVDGTGYKAIATEADGSIAWSPDNSQLVFSKSTGIWKINADGSGLIQVVSDSGSYKDWSSNNKIVYSSWNGEIYTINPDGTGKTLISTDSSKQAYGVTYSPNGTKIAYQNNDGIWWVMNSDGSNKISIGKETITCLPISFSPNSDKVVYTNMANVFTKNVDGTGEANLTNNSLPATNMFYGYSAAANKIVYLSGNSDQSEIWTMNLDGSSKTKIVTGTSGDEIAISPNGSRIAYTVKKDTNSYELWLINSDGTGQTKVEALSCAWGYLYWSPQSAKVLFSYYDPGVNKYRFLVVDSNGTNKTQLLSGTDSGNSGACWSPDGTKICFSGTIGGTSGLYVTNADGTNKVKIANSGSFPDWSSRNKIAYRGIWTISPDGSGNTKLTDGYDPRWSPNGEKIRYTEYDSNELWVMDADGNSKIRLSDESELWSENASWRSDSRKIAFTSRKNSVYLAINLINADGTGLEIISSGGLWTSYPRFSPDGSKLFYTSSGDVWVTDFEATQTNTYYIKGYVKDNSNVGISGVTLSLTGATSNTYLTGSTGYFEFLNLTGESYVITPVKSGWTFSPASRTYSSMSVSMENQDFVGSQGSADSKDELKLINNVFKPGKNEKVTIQYSVVNSGKVSIKLYTVDGILIKTLVDEDKSTGSYSIDWNGNNNGGDMISSGIYLIHIEGNGFKETKKICVIK